MLMLAIFFGLDILLYTYAHDDVVQCILYQVQTQCRLVICLCENGKKCIKS